MVRPRQPHPDVSARLLDALRSGGQHGDYRGVVVDEKTDVRALHKRELLFSTKSRELPSTLGVEADTVRRFMQFNVGADVTTVT